MNILEQIVGHKRNEVALNKKKLSINQLEKQSLFHRHGYSLKAGIKNKNKTGIIAEFKRQSPSKGVINDKADVAEVTKAYTDHGASGVSVLTDENFFGGSFTDFDIARQNEVPLLRKDFMIDEYQLFEAKAMGADVILLIAACLTAAETKDLARLAKSLKLEVLLEIHEEKELNNVNEYIDLVGVNNRNLKTFSVDLEQSVTLADKLGKDFLKIAESGISSLDNLFYLKRAGFDGFLIGENFMKQPDPAIAFADFVHQLKAKQT
ncbi:MAG: trpC [Chitinophagaceae bacterium]|nr:trpC [Chitinophagaceae bacterium]